MIYLDNSATSFPKPAQVKARMNLAMNQFGANPGRSGYEMSIRTAEEVYRCRQEAAAFFGADGPECVLFQPSCTQALNVVIKGMLRPGDHVVISDLEHNAVMRPLEKLKESGVSYTAAETFPMQPERTAQAFAQAMTDRTKLVVCTYASNVFGIRLPIPAIAEAAHERGIKICVDCAQAAGVVPIDMQKENLDFLCCAGHKGLYGPMGTGLLLVRADTDLPTLVEGGTGTSSREMTQPRELPERFESGTLNIPGIAGLRAGLAFVESRGIDRIRREEMRHVQTLYDELSRMPRVILYTPAPRDPYFVPVLSFNLKGKTSEETGALLAEQDIAVRCGLHCAPAAHEKMKTEDGTVRVSPSCFTKNSEICSFLRVIWRIARQK